MIDTRRPTRLAALAGCALVAACAAGCAMGKPKIVPDSIATCRELSRNGVAAMECGDWRRARILLEEAVDTSPTDLDARRQLAEVLWQNNSRREALVHLEAAVQLDPRHAPTLVRTGEMLLAEGAVERARGRAEEAIALDATLAGAWALRGRVFRRQGDLQRALADMQQALRYAPHMTDVLVEVAQVQFELGQPQRCLTTLHHLLDVYPPGEEPQQALWLEGVAYGAMDRHHDAVESLYAASLRGTPQAELFFQLARAEQAAGRRAAATNTIRQALALDGGHQASQLLLAQLQGFGPPGVEGIIRR